MQIGTLARGNPIYRMSSFAPTRGPVNPAGYLQRELRRQGLQGNDGQSDRRSGMAQNALQRRGIAAGDNRGGGLPRNPRNPPPSSPGGRGDTTGPLHPAEGTNTPGGPYGGIMNNAGTPVVNVNEDGTLELPFDLQTSKDALALQQDFNNRLLELQQGSQTSDLEYQMAMRAAMQGYDETKRGTLNSAAASGNAFSSAYGYAAGRNANEFANTTGNLTSQHGLDAAQTVASRQALIRDFNAALAQLIAEQAANAAGDAGSLGYGHGGKGSSGGGKGNSSGNSGGKGGKKSHHVKLKGHKIPPPPKPGGRNGPGLPTGPR